MNNKPAMGIMVTLRITSGNSYFSDKLKNGMKAVMVLLMESDIVQYPLTIP
jgi:hypothetical protein